MSPTGEFSGERRAGSRDTKTETAWPPSPKAEKIYRRSRKGGFLYLRLRAGPKVLKTRLRVAGRLIQNSEIAVTCKCF